MDEKETIVIQDKEGQTDINREDSVCCSSLLYPASISFLQRHTPLYADHIHSFTLMHIPKKTIKHTNTKKKLQIPAGEKAPHLKTDT